MNELQRFELNELEQQGEQKQIFTITDLDGLNWAFRKMNALQAKINDVKALANAERERIDKYEKSETTKYLDDLAFFEHKVKDYHAGILDHDPKAKSIKTPYGTVKSTRSKAAPEKTDESALLEYAKTLEDSFVKTEIKETLLWGELKKTLNVVESDGSYTVVDADGQLVPGVSVKPETVTFKVTVED